MPPKTSSKRKRNPNFRAVRFDFNLALGTLASGTFIAEDILGQPSQEFWAISADLTLVIEGVTPGEGPFFVCLAHDDYTVAELDEWYEATNQLTGDKIEQEQGRRAVRDIGILMGKDTQAIHTKEH